MPPDGPVLFVSLGTAFNDRPSFYRACLEAFADQGPVAMAVGQHVRVDDLGPVPGNVDVRSWFPQPAVLRHASAFVSHAGMGSTMEALYYGVPLVCVPQMLEQEVNAGRVAELGLGVRLDAARLTADDLRAAVDAVTGDAAVRAGLDRMQHPSVRRGSCGGGRRDRGAPGRVRGSAGRRLGHGGHVGLHALDGALRDGRTDELQLRGPGLGQHRGAAAQRAVATVADVVGGRKRSRRRTGATADVPAASAPSTAAPPSIAAAGRAASAFSVISCRALATSPRTRDWMFSVSVWSSSPVELVEGSGRALVRRHGGGRVADGRGGVGGHRCAGLRARGVDLRNADAGVGSDRVGGHGWSFRHLFMRAPAERAQTSATGGRLPTDAGRRRPRGQPRGPAGPRRAFGIEECVCAASAR